MNLRIAFLLVLQTSLSIPMAQSLTLSGYIQDAVTGAVLPYASVSNGSNAVYADELGFYKFTLAASEQQDTIVFSYVGYTPYILIAPSSDAGQLVRLQPQSDLPTVEVRSSRLLATGGSVVVADLAHLKTLPTLGGEVDYLKSLSLMPGISTGVEGTANLIIRGGEPEQTHLLVDGSPLYNANHLGGFLSAVPPMMVRDITVYKSGVPARYGGRLSGLIDVQLKQANTDQVTGEVLVGTATVGAMINVPISDKSGLQLAGRYAYPSLIWELASQGSYEEGVSGDHTNLYIHDLVAKYNWQISKRLTTSLTYFQSGDVAKVQGVSGINLLLEDIRWRNQMLSLRTHLDLGNGWSLKHNLYASSFDYELQEQELLVYRRDSIVQFRTDITESKIRDLGMRTSLSRQFSNRLVVELGTETIRHDFQSNSAGTPSFSDSLLQRFNNSSRAWEHAYYLSSEVTLLPQHLRASGGIRLSKLDGTGLKDWRIEPRLRLEYELRSDYLLNLSFERHYQNIHRLRAAGDLLPNQVWVVANQSAPSSNAWQLSLGVSRQTATRHWYVEAFRKELNDLTMLQFEAGDIYRFGQDWTDVVYTGGQGKVQGLEAYWAEQRGRFSGALAYTLSFSDRQFAEVNDGEWFPFRFDRRHDGSLNLGYRSATNWEITGVFIYQTGHAATIPTAVGGGLLLYDKINTFRLPSFQRLDLGVARYWQSKKHSKRETFLKLSVYNALNRANPYQLIISPEQREVVDPNTGETYRESAYKVFQASLFPILPSLTFGINFR